MRGTKLLNGQKALQATWVGMRVAGRYSERIGGWLAARLWFTPWRAELSPRALERESAWLRSTEPLSIGFRGAELRGFVAGEGPTILLVHGWGERASTMGAFVAPLTAAGYRVAAVDMPGHGATTATETDLLIQADALQQVARELGGVHGVIAHSMGGMAATLALSQGLRAERVALLAPAVRMRNALAKFNTLFVVPPKAAAGLRRHIQKRFGEDIWERLSGDRLAADLDVPALIVHDEDDPQVDPADSRSLAAAWHGAEFVETSGFGHVKIVRDRAVVMQIVDFFTASSKEERQEVRAVSA